MLLLLAVALASEPGVTINDATISAETLARWAAQGVRVREGRYWYDSRSGLWGLWDGPALGLLPAGLALGGDLAADCSAGDTGVYFNGRQLHRHDLAALQTLLATPVAGGRYWLDASGNAGLEGGPALVNLWAVAQARQGGTWSWSGGSAGAVAGSAFVCSGGDCSSWSP